MFRLAGTDVFLHWSWFAVAYFQIQGRAIPYSSMVWDVAEYVAGFGIVLAHEFGHVLACRQVGGSADRVVLWPLGGLAFVAPPPRPGANLWTTVAGPLVNVVLAPVFILLAFLTAPAVDVEVRPDLHHLMFDLAVFNTVMLVFNLLPIFPLDGGRILQAVLWWFVGRSWALSIAAGIGIAAGGGLGVLALWAGEWWMALMAGFLFLGAMGGFSHARLLERIDKAERRTDLACPNCGLAPPQGDFWRCPRCLSWFDLFAPVAACPKGGGHSVPIACVECGYQPLTQNWIVRLPLEGAPESAKE